MTLPRCPECNRTLPAERADGLCPACLLGADTAESAEATKLIDRSPNIGAPEALESALTGLEISEQIGQGGMGSVYKARQIKLDRDVAVKVMSKALSESPEFQERFTREAKTLARLSHPNVVSIYDYGEADGHLYLVMEYIDGCNLRQYLQQETLSPDHALAIIPQICDALDYAHGKGVVHRDIKPENIILDRDGKVHIADFGIAKLLDAGADDATLTLTNQAIGSRNYMAPEQIEHAGQVDERADIYSLGVVLYEMLTGELPIGRFAPPSRKSDVDERVDDVVLKSLEKDPSNRYHRVVDVQTDVESIRQGPPQLPQTASPTLEREQPKRYCTTAILAFALMLLPILLIPIQLLFMPMFMSVIFDSLAAAGFANGLVIVLNVIQMLLGVAKSLAAVASCVFGRIAISKIRREPERLTGMGLAVAATVCHPLIIINRLIWGCGLFFENVVVATSALVIACLVMDVVFVRTIWRAVNRPAAKAA